MLGIVAAMSYRLSSSVTVAQTPSNPSVAVAMSGGIDSTVTALLLKRQGFSITGVFMRNWDNPDEAGDDHQCPINQDFEDAKEVCARLGIACLEVNFVKDYWNSVFMPFVEDYQSNARTPNPDVSCNSHIKFHKFREHVLYKLQFDCMATGHYVRATGHPPSLLRGRDLSKDQSYFLSTTAGQNFENVLFPIGHLTKQEVKQIAQEATELKGLRVLRKKESMGICFVGKRKMSEFLPQYFSPTPGRFIDIDSGLVVGTHEGAELFTVGQKAKIGGAAQKYFIARKCVSTEEGDPFPKHHDAGEKFSSVSLRKGDVLVAAGAAHPSLQSNVLEASLDAFNWVAGKEPAGLSADHVEKKVYQLQIRHLQKPKACTISILPPRTRGDCSVLRLELCAGGQGEGAAVEEPMLHAATPGQIVAVYDGDTCLGGGPIWRALLYAKQQMAAS
mmetsp:Transcript_25788/g.48398  ORF Transcript_25788/g.48398 Transcript_25788/m.48398 type:complete len:445 (+) Transcript_25788:54-1388(+)